MTKLVWIIFAIIMVFSLTSLMLVFSHLSYNSHVLQLKSEVYETREEIMQLKDCIDDIEQYIPKELFDQLLREYEDADQASSELLQEYLKIAGD